jgi:hypothetical protein
LLGKEIEKKFRVHLIKSTGVASDKEIFSRPFILISPLLFQVQSFHAALHKALLMAQHIFF